jgi:hypothetical protein
VQGCVRRPRRHHALFDSSWPGTPAARPRLRRAARRRFCKYPQEIVLRLEKPSKIGQIQILAHEYKV